VKDSNLELKYKKLSAPPFFFYTGGADTGRLLIGDRAVGGFLHGVFNYFYPALTITTIP